MAMNMKLGNGKSTKVTRKMSKVVATKSTNMMLEMQGLHHQATQGLWSPSPTKKKQ